jgi:solute carrier family 35 protein F1/2
VLSSISMSHPNEHRQRDLDQANDISEIEAPVERITVKTKGTTTTPDPSTPSSSINGRLHGTPEILDDGRVLHQPEERDGLKKKRFAYLRTRDFWIVLLLTQIIALAQTGTNTLTSLIVARGTSIPAFQTFFNYVLLNVVYTSFTIYKYGFAKWSKMVVKDGWRFFILAFLDVEGNYFIVLAYKYTNLLSAQLFSFWTVIVVVVISLVLLKVRYHIAQYGGIVLACGGFAVLIASDYITKSNNYVSHRQASYSHTTEKLMTFI